MPPPLAVELGDRVGAQPQRAAEAAQVGLVLGHEVGAPQPVQLDAVLHGAQEAVGAVQLGGVVPADVAAGDSASSASRVLPLRSVVVAAAVHELEQLDGELDVAQPAGAELELAVDLGRRGWCPRPGGASSARRRRSSAASAACHTSGATASTYAPPSARSPATGRALSSAWNSQVLAQRW